jgi:protein AroM
VKQTVGLLTIGQSPRSDLSSPLRDMRPDLDFLEIGALDNLTLDEATTLPSGDYPLNTCMRDGSLVAVDRAVLEPLLQQALGRLEAGGVVATMLMCAGTFPDLCGSRPLFNPFLLARETLRAVGLSRIGIICPYAEQEHAIGQRWRNAGFDTVIETVALSDFDKVDGALAAWTELPHSAAEQPVEAVVLDYVGHEPFQVARLQENCTRPVIDLGYLAMRVLASSLPVNR